MSVAIALPLPAFCENCSREIAKPEHVWTQEGKSRPFIFCCINCLNEWAEKKLADPNAVLRRNA